MHSNRSAGVNALRISPADHGRDANHCRKRGLGPIAAVFGFKAFDWKAGDYATVSSRIDMGTAKILHQLPTVERTSSRISNKRVENQRLGTDFGSGGRWFESTQLYQALSASCPKCQFHGVFFFDSRCATRCFATRREVSTDGTM